MRFRLLLGLLLVVPAPPAAALDTITVGTGHGDLIALDRHVEVLEDATGTWTIDEVASPAFDARFAPSPGEGFNAGLTRSAWWLRFRLHDDGSAAPAWLVELPCVSGPLAMLPNPPLADAYGSSMPRRR